MSEISDWFKSLPIFTRHWFGLTVALSLVGRFGILSPRYLVLDYQSIFQSYHVCIVPLKNFSYMLNKIFRISNLFDDYFLDMAPADRFVLLSHHSENWIPFSDQPVFPFQLLRPSRKRTVRRKACRLPLHANLQLDLLRHNRSIGRVSGK